MEDQSQCFSFFTLQRTDKHIQNIVCVEKSKTGQVILLPSFVGLVSLFFFSFFLNFDFLIPL